MFLLRGWWGRGGVIYSGFNVALNFFFILITHCILFLKLGLGTLCVSNWSLALVVKSTNLPFLSPSTALEGASTAPRENRAQRAFLTDARPAPATCLAAKFPLITNTHFLFPQAVVLAGSPRHQGRARLPDGRTSLTAKFLQSQQIGCPRHSSVPGTPARLPSSYQELGARGREARELPGAEGE